jgi:hypothetical protein
MMAEWEGFNEQRRNIEIDLCNAKILAGRFFLSAARG